MSALSCWGYLKGNMQEKRWPLYLNCRPNVDGWWHFCKFFSLGRLPIGLTPSLLIKVQLSMFWGRKQRWILSLSWLTSTEMCANLPVPLVFLWISSGKRIRLKRCLTEPEAPPQRWQRADLATGLPLTSTEQWPNDFTSQILTHWVFIFC